MVQHNTSEPTRNQFGTFSGVFVPNLLTILGVIMFMRMGWVVGQAGFYHAFLILLIANSITFLTSLSLASIATNIRVEGGGAYFLISRSLGLEIGSSIGVPFFLAQTVSVAFYIVGFTESLLPLLGNIGNPLWISLTVLFVIFVVSWLSSDLALKAQNLILIILLLALVSFFAGWKTMGHFETNLQSDYSKGFEFWTVFAIFFPAVTGIMAGASMSGDLKEPSKSIPLGTIAAVVVTFLIYAFQIFFFSRNATREELIGNNFVMRDMSVVPQLIYAGVWAATLSSAIASLLGAPRTLQALAKDGVGPKLFAKKSGKRGEPRVALIASTLLATACLVVGDLNMIAPVISMFFLATYAMINLVAGIEAWSGNPSYRPIFRVHWVISLIGALGCLWVMFLLNAIATIISVILIFGLYSLLASRRYETAWGDTWSGFWFNLTRVALIKFTASRQHIRNWRPVILVLSGNPNTRGELVRFAHLFESKKGFIFLAQILMGDWDQNLKHRDSARASMDKFILDSRITGESRIVVAPDFEDGVCSLIQSSGVGPLAPNTVLLGWSGDLLNTTEYLKTLRRILELHQNLVIHVEASANQELLSPTIDVWWGAKVNGSLMLIFAHLLQCNREWRDRKIRLLSIIGEDRSPEEVSQELQKVVVGARIQAEVIVIPFQGTAFQTIQTHSSYSEVTFAGFNLTGFSEDAELFEAQKRFLIHMKGNVFLVKNWQELEL